MSTWILGWAGAGGSGDVCVSGISVDLGVATCVLLLSRQSSAFLCPSGGNYTCVAFVSKCLNVLCLFLLLVVQEVAAEIVFASSIYI